jgi:hypothetical protein
MRPLGLDQIEVRTACAPGVYRVGYQLGARVTEQPGVAAAIVHHHILDACGCMAPVWGRYRTPGAPNDLDGLRERFNTVWAGIEGQQRRQGYAVVDWAVTVRQLAGER